MKIATDKLKKHLNIDVKDAGGMTALHMAAVGGNHNVVKLLVDNGANLLAKGYIVDTATIVGQMR